MKALLSIGEAALCLGVSVDTVRELERTGQLKAARTPGGHRRLDPAVLDAYQRRHNAPTERRREAPAPAPARRRNRTRRRQEEPVGEERVEPEPIERPKPAEKPIHIQLLEELTAANEERAERDRIANLKSFGRSLIPFGATPSARSAVLEVLDDYVTARRFTPSAATWEAREAIRAKVEGILEPYNEAAARKAQADARRAEQEREDEHVRALIERGKSRATLKTIGWDNQDARDARADVLEALEDQVGPDWNERDVKNLVDDVLDKWEETDE